MTRAVDAPPSHVDMVIERPKHFATRGHDAAAARLLATLRHAPPHALLILGPRGAGAGTLARDAAALLLCAAPTHDGACGSCRSCNLVRAESHADLSVVSPSGASDEIGIEPIRALADFKGTGDDEPIDVKVELPVDAHLPHAYIPAERLRLDIYKRLADAHDDAGIDAMREEIEDRYGPLPKPVETLLAVARLRADARAAGLNEIVLVGANVRFAPVDLAESASLRLGRLYPRSTVKPATRTILIPRPQAATIGGDAPRDVELLNWVREVITTLRSPIATNVSG